MFDNTTLAVLTKTAKAIRKDVLAMILAAHASHIGSSFSIVEILVYLYEEVLLIDPKNPLDPQRDRFILSKGWGVSTLYAILAQKGFFQKDMLQDYCQDGSKLIGCATRNGIPGIEATTGSMGHGLPLGVGMALAGKVRGQTYKTFVVISDGECDEGSTWEAMLIGAHHKLNNLIVIIDYNKWQSFGRVKDVLSLDSLKAKWQAGNWHVQEIDGHDFTQLHTAFLSQSLASDKPNFIIANTIKGKGLSAIEDKNEWHYQTPRADEIACAKREGLL
jgi:transketolase